VLIGLHHQKLWDIVYPAVKPLVPTEQAAAIETKLAGFWESYGTTISLRILPHTTR
jgi:predicted oxidoreductase (fatty acid repression mutant protein)